MYAIIYVLLYLLQFIDVACLVVELLHDTSIASEEHWQWEPAPYTGKYGELNTGSWWRDAAFRMKAAEIGCFVCPISVYADEAQPDWRKGTGFKPIVISCGNYVGSVSRTVKGVFPLTSK